MHIVPFEAACMDQHDDLKQSEVKQSLKESTKESTESSKDSSTERPGESASSAPPALSDQILPPNLFILPTPGPVVFPTLMAPINVSVPRFVATVEEAINRQRLIGLILAREGAQITSQMGSSDLYSTGVVVRILKRLKMPDGSVNLLVHCMKRFSAKRFLSEEPHLVAEVEYLEDQLEKSTEMDALTRSVISHVKKLAEVNPFFTEEMRLAMINAPGPGTVADLVAFSLSLPKAEAQKFLETLSVKSRFETLLVHLRREQDVADLQRKIQDDVNSKLSTMQREFFLKEQLKVIKRELGIEVDGKDKTTKTFRERIEAAGMPEEAKKAVFEELEKFESLSENSPEHNMLRSYLEMACSLPWSVQTDDQLNLQRAKVILNEDHYGLEKVKERVLEFLAVRKLSSQAKNTKEKKGSILCLVGPPGVGKTSVAKSMARTLGRKFFRFSLGGMRDEAEIKGHRRTYVGALPGKILQGMKRAGSLNPVIVLDEIDKLAQSFQGDPASALLEVLDPEQNSAFLDHYLDIPFDLSKVLFVATANNIGTIPPALLDRLEVIEIPGYTLEEKESIAQRYLIPKVLSEHGLKQTQLKIEKGALRAILQDYAREPGVRTLQQLVEKIARKAAVRIIGQGELSSTPPGAIIVHEEELRDWLGAKRYTNDVVERITTPGVVVGLAWTALGGDILFIEATDLPGTGALKMTGKMGETMSESASIAWTYAKKKVASELKVGQEYFKERDYHLHIPAGGIPKDGPSAGITMATALYSLMTGKKSRQKLAMTGELSLTGKVLPVGGIKEKLLAARRAGIETVLLPKLNEKDLFDVPEYATQGMEIRFVNRLEEVLDLAFEQKPTRVLSKKSKRFKKPVAKKIKRSKRPVREVQRLRIV